MIGARHRVAEDGTHHVRRHVGDEIRFAAGGGTFIYAVTGSRVVPPTALEVLLPEPGRRTMTLITCHPEHSTKERLVVAADFVGFSPAG